MRSIWLAGACALGGALALAVVSLIKNAHHALGLGLERVADRVQNYDFGLLGFATLLWIVALAFEVLVLGYRKSTLCRLFRFKKNEQIDIFCSVAHNLLTTGVTVGVFTLGIAFIVRQSVELTTGFQITALLGSATISIIVALLISELISYWEHRLSHRWDFWWQFHKYHHSAKSLNLITNNRRHPIDNGIGQIVFAVPMALTGTPEEIILSVAIARAFLVRLRHSEMDFDYGVLGNLIVSPNFHRRHHLSDLEPANFGYTFSFWDHVFGTFRPPVKPSPDLVYGTKEFDADRYGLLEGWLVCAADVFRSAIASLRPHLRRRGGGGACLHSDPGVDGRAAPR